MPITRLKPLSVFLFALLAAAGCQDQGLSPLEQIETGLTPRIPAPGQANWNLEERMAYYGVHGMSLAVVAGNELVLAKSYGVGDPASGAPVTEGTLFQVGGGAKLATELAVLKLVSEGKLSLDTPINDVLQSWKLPDAQGEGRESSVTVRQVLNHTGGLNVPFFLGYRPGDALPTLLQVLEGEAPASTPPIRVTSEPGTFQSSAGGYAVVQQALVDLTGKPFSEFMRSEVFEPLGMNDSTFDQPPDADLLARAASGHLPHGGAVEGKGRLFPASAAGGLWTTPSDLARLISETLRAAAGQSGGLVKPEVENDALAPIAAGLAEGRELILGDFERLQEYDGFYSAYALLPRRGLGAVVMTNVTDGGPFVGEVLRAVARAYQWPNYLLPEVEPHAMTAEELDLFTGRYAAGQDNTIIVTRGDGHLLMRRGFETLATRMIPISEDTFINQSSNARITFRRERDGRAGAYTFRNRADQEVVLPRIASDDLRPTELLTQGRLDEAIEAYRQLDPPVAAARINNVGYSFFNQGKLEAAAAVFELAVELYPRSTNLFDSLGEVYHELGEKQKAVQAFQQAQELALVDDTLDDDTRASLRNRARYFLTRLES